MRRRVWLSFSVVTAVAFSGAVRAAEPLPGDARILTGKLKNGATWMYRKHDNPPGKMALMMHVDTGSLNEKDKQRGLAHFTEHMVFNGSEHFPPGALIPYFESIGMEFGGDVNAFTSFDQTSYMIFLPDTTPEQIDKALMVLSDQGSRASLLEEEIDKERGVILAEKRAGQSARQRIRDKLWPELFAGTRFAERIPIGTEEVIENATRPDFEDYYRTWYRPERVTVMIVGDTDPEPVIPLIEKWFGQYTPEAPTRQELKAEFKNFEHMRAIVVTDPEQPSCEVEMYNVSPGRPPTTTVDQYRTELIEELAAWIMRRRFEQMIQKGEASFVFAWTSAMDFFNEAMLATGSARGEPERWDRMLEQLTVEVTRAKEHGFTKRELELAKKELLSEAERDVRTDPTQNARSILFQMNRAVNDEEPIVPAKDRLALAERLLPTITRAEVDESFARYFGADTFAFVLKLPEKEGVVVPDTETVLAAAKAASDRKTEPPKEQEEAKELLAAVPEPGKVVESTFDEDLGITSAWLDTGVRVHHRFMDYKKDTVLVSISLAGGKLEETKANAGVTDVATLAFDQPATSRLSSPEITDLMTGKNIRVRAGADDDTLTIDVNGSPKDLEAGLQLVHAILTDGKIEESAFNTFVQRNRQRLRMMMKTPEFRAFEATAQATSGDDPRLTPMTVERLDALTLSAAQAWLERISRESPIEVAIVGEMALDDVMPLISRYIGSLPKRGRSSAHLDALRKINRATGPWERRVDVETVTPRGMVIFGFIGADGADIADNRALNLAEEVLSSRLIKRVREDLSLVYSIRAGNRPSFAYKGGSVFMTGAPCDPAKVAEVLKEAESIFTDFAENGPTEGQLENAKKQILNNIDEEEKEPRFWRQFLAHLDLHKLSLAEQKRKKEAYSAFDAAQVRDVFRTYFKEPRTFRTVAVPKKVETETAPPEPAGVGAEG